MSGARSEEIMIAAITRMLSNLSHVAVGASSPIPGSAALLARELSGGALKVSLLGRASNPSFTDGGRELFDCAAQGRIDAYFLSGAQIDGQANINLVTIGDPDRPNARFPGSFGSAYLYFLVPRVILFRVEHSTRSLVPKVDYISAPGVSEPNIYRPGGPYALVTGRCVFDFSKKNKCFRLKSLHPGHSVEDIKRETGFAFDVPASETIPETELPSAEWLGLIRGSVGDEIREIYPDFATKMFGGA
ncbi:MAG: CoA-transferase [Methyloligellaceae bacterium]